ncbi:HNH endonuclease family protein [Nocardiopsis sediminis]|uniref:HNH endonuclease family protein n=1 Tax=Nocardiopsis sediminis TaxID=1778267 RepID=A0ABV8FNW3_9ACTN
MARSSRSPDERRGRGRRTGAVASVLALIVLAVVVSALTGGNVLDTLRAITGGDGTPSASSPAPGGSGGPDGPSDLTAAEARDLLGGLEIAEPQPRGDYERSEFGHSWVDTDDNGCPTRHDILARDLDQVRADADCTVREGVLDDPYTGERLEFSSDDPQAVQIDHVVPLSLAWRMGADDWDRDRRVEFANDPGNLLAADGPANGQKGDSGPAEWQPYEGFRCAYAIAYVDVSHRYGLAVSQEDHDALGDGLGTCG